jgi:Flp pilus assembly protein TadG
MDMAAMRRHGRCRRGLAVVEASIIMNVLLLLVLGTLEYGWLFTVSDGVHNAARQGARLAALPGSTATGVKAGVETVLANSKLSGMPHTVTITPADLSTVPAGSNVKVDVSVTYSSLTHIVPTPGSLQGSVTMVREGP